MKDLIRERDIDYISAPIAPVLKGEKVHYEYVAFRKQIEDISPVPAIPISEGATNGDMIKVLFNIKEGEIEMSHTYYVRFPEEDLGHYFSKDWWNSPYKRGDTDE